MRIRGHSHLLEVVLFRRGSVDQLKITKFCDKLGLDRPLEFQVAFIVTLAGLALCAGGVLLIHGTHVEAIRGGKKHRYPVSQRTSSQSYQISTHEPT